MGFLLTSFSQEVSLVCSLLCQRVTSSEHQVSALIRECQKDWTTPRSFCSGWSISLALPGAHSSSFGAQQWQSWSSSSLSFSAQPALRGKASYLQPPLEPAIAAAQPGQRSSPCLTAAGGSHTQPGLCLPLQHSLQDPRREQSVFTHSLSCALVTTLPVVCSVYEALPFIAGYFIPPLWLSPFAAHPKQH